jgi:hypothetical protein
MGCRISWLVHNIPWNVTSGANDMQSRVLEWKVISHASLL